LRAHEDLSCAEQQWKRDESQTTKEETHNRTEGVRRSLDTCEGEPGW
jgi:hypothetical protein